MDSFRTLSACRRERRHFRQLSLRGRWRDESCASRPRLVTRQIEVATAAKLIVDGEPPEITLRRYPNVCSRALSVGNDSAGLRGAELRRLSQIAASPTGLPAAHGLGIGPALDLDPKLAGRPVSSGNPTHTGPGRLRSRGAASGPPKLPRRRSYASPPRCSASSLGHLLQFEQALGTPALVFNSSARPAELHEFADHAERLVC
jgi:hypothetical protein